MDINFVRAQFPALQRDNFIYMDNAGGSQILKTVVDKISDYLITTNVQLGGTYKASKTASTRVHEGEVAAAKFMNAADDCEAVIGPSTTQLVANLATAMEPNIIREHEFIITQADHEANVGPFTRLAKKIGCPVKWWKVRGENHVLDVNDLIPLLSAKTRLVAFTHCSNVLGTINDVKKIVEVIRSRTGPDTEIIVDGVAYAPHRRVDVQDLGVDYYVISFYKIYGPHVSCLYAKKSSQLKLSSLAHFFIPDSVLPYKLQPGGPNYESTYSITAVLEYFDALGSRNSYHSNLQDKLNGSFKIIAAHEYQLQKAILDFLVSHPDHFRIVGLRTSDISKRVPTVSFVVKGWKSSTFVEHLDKIGRIGIRFGHFYAKRLMDEVLQLGDIDGVVRISCSHYNTIEEVRFVLDKIESVAVKGVKY